MLLPIISVLDSESGEIVRCAITRDRGDCWDLKPLEPMFKFTILTLRQREHLGEGGSLGEKGLNLRQTQVAEEAHFDPTSYSSISNLSFHMAWWRVAKNDMSVDATVVGQFDTTILHRLVQEQLSDL